jgi:hypothetical protein
MSNVNRSRAVEKWRCARPLSPRLPPGLPWRARRIAHGQQRVPTWGGGRVACRQTHSSALSPVNSYLDRMFQTIVNQGNGLVSLPDAVNRYAGLVVYGV